MASKVMAATGEFNLQQMKEMKKARVLRLLVLKTCDCHR